jgi:WD40 repeat protein
MGARARRNTDTPPLPRQFGGARVQLWDLSGSAPQRRPIFPEQAGFVKAFSPDGRRLVTSPEDGTVQIWDLTATTPVSPTILRGHPGRVSVAAFSADGQRLAVGSDDGTIQLWDVAGHPSDPEFAQHAHEDTITMIGFGSADRLVAADAGGATRLWDLSDAGPGAGGIALHDAGTPLFDADGKLITISALGDVKRWSIDPTGAISGSIVLQQPGARYQLSSGGRQLATFDAEGVMRVWDVQAANPASTGRVLLGATFPIVFSPDGRKLISNGPSEPELWDLQSSGADLRPTPLQDSGRIETFSPNQRWALTADEGGKIRLWDLAADPPTARSIAAALPLTSRGLLLSSDGRYVAVTMQGDFNVQLWDLAADDPSAGPVMLPNPNPGQLEPGEALFSPHRAVLAIATQASVRLWGVANSGSITTPIVLNRATLPLAFSADGRWLATGSADNIMQLWDLTAADPAASPITLPGRVKSDDTFAFSPDGRRLAATMDKETVWLWPLDPAEIARLICDIAGRNLTLQEWQQYFGRTPYHRTCDQLPQSPDITAGMLDQAIEAAREGRIAEALATYETVERSDPQFFITGYYWSRLCRLGALWDMARDVYESCGRAVALDPNNGAFHDSRGIARALMSDSTGAIEDFRAYLRLAKASYQELILPAYPAPMEESILQPTDKQRTDWIDALLSGRNPFDEATLKALREAE